MDTERTLSALISQIRNVLGGVMINGFPNVPANRVTILVRAGTKRRAHEILNANKFPVAIDLEEVTPELAH